MRTSAVLTHGAAAAVGAVAMYLADPAQGRSRRSVTADKVGAGFRQAEQAVEQQVRHAEQRAEGLQAQAKGGGTMEPVSDHVVKQGIEQQLSDTEIDVSDVVIDVTDGVVGLRGQVSSTRDLEQLEVATMDVPGVREIESWLHLPGELAPNKQPARTLGN